jgi:hypothetical protein
MAPLTTEVAALRAEVAALRTEVAALLIAPPATPEITDADLADFRRVARIGVDREFEAGEFGGKRAEAARLSSVLRKLAQLPSVAGLRVVVLPRRHGRRRFVLRRSTGVQSGAPHCASQPDDFGG